MYVVLSVTNMIRCSNCKNVFNPNEKEQESIRQSAKKGMTFIMLTCRNCGLGFGVNPTTLLHPEPNEALPLRTPLSGIHGFISLIEDDSEIFYGCGASGAIWRDKKNLNRDIERIIKKYPHRKDFYLFKNGEWIANPDEPNNTDELIDSEAIEAFDNFEMD